MCARWVVTAVPHRALYKKRRHWMSCQDLGHAVSLGLIGRSCLLLNMYLAIVTGDILVDISC